MNLGQRIWLKSQNNQSIDQEVKEILEIIDQIAANENPVYEIDLNGNLSDVHKFLEEYVKIIDEKLYNIQNKYFEPNGLKLNIRINKTELYDQSFITVDSREEVSEQIDFSFIETTSDEIEYDFVDDLFAEFESKIYPKLLNILNISQLGLSLAALWYVASYGDDNFKIIETDRDT